MMKTVAVVRAGPHKARLAEPVADAFTRCFEGRGWRVQRHEKPIKGEPDFVAGYGWREVMVDAYSRWPGRVLHVDGGFWGRDRYVKLAMGGRWSPLSGRDYDGGRLGKHQIIAQKSRAPGKRVLVCGMSEKAATSWGLDEQEWERWAVEVLRSVGADVIFRPKPNRGGKKIKGAAFDEGTSIYRSLNQVDAVATHHSNAAIDAIVAGLPIYVEVGLAEPMSVGRIEDLPGAPSHSITARSRFLREVAWHQWTLEELASGIWMKPPAPLADRFL